MKTLPEFIEEHAIAATATPATHNPHMSDHMMFHWSVTLECDGRKLVTPFSCGAAFRVWKKGARRAFLREYGGEVPKLTPKDGERVSQVWTTPFYRIELAGWREFLAAHAEGEPPTAPDVLHCLLSDAAGVENAPDFESWAEEYGYDTDSRQAEAMWKAVHAQTAHLRRFLGEHYEEALWELEGY